MRTPSREVIEWISELIKKDIKEFRYRDLPEDVKIKKMIQKARTLGVLERLRKDENGLITWKVVPNGNKYIKSMLEKDDTIKDDTIKDDTIKDDTIKDDTKTIGIELIKNNTNDEELYKRGA